MLISYEREKLIQAIAYFAWHMEVLDKAKLFKLLYLADIASFHESGLTVTGMTYRACTMGPVPGTLEHAWHALPADLAAAFEIRPGIAPDSIVPRRRFDDAHFNRREMRIMASLADGYRAHSGAAIDVSETDNGAWKRTLQAGRGLAIDYALTIGEGHPYPEAVFEAATEYRALLAAGKIILALASPC